QEMGLKYPLEGIEPPAEDRVKNAKELLHTDNYTKYLTR
ncbi:MAG: pyruvate formate lyase 1-activating protein, partial [Enterococcus canintestini]